MESFLSVNRGLQRESVIVQFRKGDGRFLTTTINFHKNLSVYYHGNPTGNCYADSAHINLSATSVTLIKDNDNKKKKQATKLKKKGI